MNVTTGASTLIRTMPSASAPGRPSSVALTETPGSSGPLLVAADAGTQADAAPRLTLPWVIRLRWAALTAQAVIAVAGSFTGWLPAHDTVILLVALGAASNVGLMIASRLPALTGSKGLVGWTLVLDVVLLTALLTVTGGPSNPFTVVYLVYVTLAAVALGAGWTWLIVATAVGGYASLFLWPPPPVDHSAHTDGLPSHLAGMWVAFATSAAVIAFFVTGVTRTLARRERELADMRQVATRHERLASLTTLAAGAAHELATPLASIAVAARELERSSADLGAPAVTEDARLIRSQVERCRLILDQMSGRASQEWVEAPRTVRVKDVVSLVQDGLDAGRRARLEIDVPPDLQVQTASAGLVQALLNLVRNAFDASPADGIVSLLARPSAQVLSFHVQDRGTGMPADVLARAGEPFFTTKAPGAGYGLGLFLVRLFAERHGGTLTITSEPGRGATVRLDLPRDAHL